MRVRNALLFFSGMIRMLAVMRGNVTTAFVMPSPSVTSCLRTTNTKLWESSVQQEQQSEIEVYLAENFPSFYNLLLVNAVDVLKSLRNPNMVFTIFAPNDDAFAALGDKKLQQLRDPRNSETTNKIAAFHVIVDDTEAVTADMILDPSSNIGGVMTLAGEVPIGPSQSGGFFGFGAQADGGVIVGPGAKIVSSINGPGGVVHEVDGLMSPTVIWRYMDQLRLPGL